MADVGELIVRIKADIAQLENGLDKATKQTDSAMSQIGKAIAGGALAFKAFEAIGKGIEFNKAAEQAKIAFTVMTGSATKATQTLKELKSYADTTPLEFKDLRQSTQTLIQFGVKAEDAIGIIKQLGDISGGNAEKLQSLSVAFGKVSAAGKLTGENVMMMVDAGFNPLKEISDRTGESMASLQKRMEKGAISVDEVKKSFEATTSAGGMFFGMLEKQGQSLGGKLSTMSDAIDTALGSMTKAFEGPIKAGADAVTAISNAFSSLPAPVQAATGAIIAVGAATLALQVGLATLANMAPALGIKISTAMGPIGLAIAGATALLMGLIAAFDDAAKKTKEAVAANTAPIAELFGQVGAQADETNRKLAVFSAQFATAKTSAKDLEYIKNNFNEVAKAAGVTPEILAEMIVRSGKFSQAVVNAAKDHRNASLAQEDAIISLSNRYALSTLQQQSADNRSKAIRDAANAARVEEFKLFETELVKINNFEKQGMLTSEQSGAQKIEVYEKMIKKIQGEADATGKLTKEQRKQATEAIAQINKIIESLKEKSDVTVNTQELINNAHKKNLEADAKEYESSQKLTNEDIKKTDKIIENIHKQEEADRVAFATRKALASELPEVWSTAVDVIGGKLLGMSNEMTAIFKGVGTAITAISAGISLSAGDIAGAALKAVGMVFDLIQSNAKKTADEQIKQIDRAQQALLISLGYEEDLSGAAQQAILDKFVADNPDGRISKERFDAQTSEQAARLANIEAKLKDELGATDAERLSKREEIGRLAQENRDRIIVKNTGETEESYQARLRSKRDSEAYYQSQFDVIEAEAAEKNKKSQAKYLESLKESNAAYNSVVDSLREQSDAYATKLAELTENAIRAEIADRVTGGKPKTKGRWLIRDGVKIWVLDEDNPFLPQESGLPGNTSPTQAQANAAQIAANQAMVTAAMGDSATYINDQGVVSATPRMAPQNRPMQQQGSDGTMGANSRGVSVVVNNYSPTALDPSQSAAMTRQSMRQLSFQGAFA